MSERDINQALIDTVLTEYADAGPVTLLLYGWGERIYGDEPERWVEPFLEALKVESDWSEDLADDEICGVYRNANGFFYWEDRFHRTFITHLANLDGDRQKALLPHIAQLGLMVPDEGERGPRLEDCVAEGEGIGQGRWLVDVEEDVVTTYRLIWRAESGGVPRDQWWDASGLDWLLDCAGMRADDLEIEEAIEDTAPASVQAVILRVKAVT